jgi:hypothetical protein
MGVGAAVGALPKLHAMPTTITKATNENKITNPLFFI